jgi:murein DD-endopeptidase MepM/ murein hydrolase activator NlpD
LKTGMQILKHMIPSCARETITLSALALGMLLIITGILGSDPVEAKRIGSAIDLPLPTSAQVSEPATTTRPSQDRDPPTAGTGQTTEPDWQELEVRRGDNLSLIFARAGLQATDLQGILEADGNGKSLRNIFPGQIIYFKRNTDGRLIALRYAKSPLESSVFIREADTFRVDREIRSPDIRTAFRFATLKSSLFEAGKEAGLSGRMILDLANVFGGVIDFVLDPRTGDTFTILYEELYLDGEKIGDGAIIAAEYVNAGRNYAAFRYTSPDGDQGFFSADGVSMRKAFLLAPLDFTRVSSNFNMRRLHPIAKVVRPHRGVDYSAPTGTPVYSSGDGKVTASGYNRANGNYVFVQHGNRYMTRYLHLHKRSVNAGQRVKQGDTIGTVGATGLATGPHLHYEFLVDGVHRDPRKVLGSLPRAQALTGTELARFSTQISATKSQLATYTSAWQMAIASGAE